MKNIAVRIDGKFVEITWQEGKDKKILLLTPKDIIENYRAAQQKRAADFANSGPPRAFVIENGECRERPAGEMQSG